jgi:NADH:ubiquinone oxidoreductase subunit 4 (subunit M)
MIQKVFYGEAVPSPVQSDLKTGEVIAMVAIIAMILISGFYPGPLLKLGSDEVWQAATTVLQP